MSGIVNRVGAKSGVIGAKQSASGLSDYEEGTWTAVLKEGTTTVTIADNTMIYLRIGKLVYVCGYFIVNDSSSATGNVSLEGLPYAMDNTIDSADNWCDAHLYDQYDDGFTTSGYTVHGQMNYSDAVIYFKKNGWASGGVSNVHFGQMNNTQQVRLTATYIGS